MSRREHAIAVIDDAIHAAADGCEESSEYYADRIIAILAGIPLASTPPHEQQNEPSSSPARAPGDEPAEPLGYVVIETTPKEGGGLKHRVRHDWDGALLPLDVATSFCRDMNAKTHATYIYTVEPVGRAEREPRTSEPREHLAMMNDVDLAPPGEPPPFALPVRVDVAFFTPIGKEKIAVVRLLDAGGQEVAKFVESPDDVENGHDWLIRCAWFIADCINARRAAPPSSENPE